MNTEILNTIKENNFDKFIINIAYECINYIRSANIQFLNSKSDGTPLSSADLEIDKIISKNLSKFNPLIKILSEEHEFTIDSYMEDFYWIIDPIDGTKSYLNGGIEYTVNIALINKGVPILGLIAHPPSKKIWYAKNNKLVIINNGFKKIYSNSKPVTDRKPSIITSRENTLEMRSFLNKVNKFKRIKLSSSLKFCKLAEDKADFYPRFSSISKWDIAAGHAILNASGGELIDFKGKHLRYNNRSSKTGKFLALANKSMRQSVISLLR